MIYKLILFFERRAGGMIITLHHIKEIRVLGGQRISFIFSLKTFLKKVFNIFQNFKVFY